MLSTNSILRQGRYRIIDQLSSTAASKLYDAYDNLLGNKVVIQETLIAHGKVVTSTERNAGNAAFAERIQTLKDIRHDGIVRVRDGFSEIDRQYLVTEPVEARPARQEFLLQPVETISRLLLAIEFINKLDGPAMAGITPSQIRRTSDGNNRLLYFGAAEHRSGTNDRDDLPFKPLETLWHGLDLASQKAISHSYDERSLETLESHPDVRTAIYGLGATVYSILADTAPTDALERSIEVLDGKPDPLVSPNAIDPAISSELAGFVLTCLQLKREGRFQTVSEARMALVIVPAAARPVAEPASPLDLDDLDLLEIPQPARVARQPIASEVKEQVAALIFDTSSDDDFLMTEPEIELVPKTISVSAEQTATFFSGMDGMETTERSKTLRWAYVAIAGVIVVAGAVWGIFSFASAGSSVAGAEFNNGAAVMKEPVAVSTPLPAAEPVVANKQEPVSADPVTETKDVPAEPQDSIKTRPVVADVKPPKRTEAQPIEKPAAKPKKSVTVDDLINDN